MLTRELLDRLATAGLPIVRHQLHGWFAGPGNNPTGPTLGPFHTPEEALIAGVEWLATIRAADPPPDDEPPEPFRKLLG